MVSVAFAIWLFPQLPERQPARWARRAPLGAKHPAAKCPLLVPHVQQATCQFAGPSDATLASILHSGPGGADPDDVDDVPSLSEPHGPDGSMAERGRIGIEIFQP